MVLSDLYRTTGLWTPTLCKNKYPLPLISKFINKLQGARYCTWLNLMFVGVSIMSRWKKEMSGNLPSGLYEPLVMFFSLTNSLATFQTMMDAIFKDLISEGVVVVYLDDILIFTKTLEEHQTVVWKVLEILQQHNLSLKLEKCKFEKFSMEYLEVVISHNSVKMDLAKVAGVSEWPTPTNRKEVQSFLGFTNFYWRFIEGLSHISRPVRGRSDDQSTTQSH